MHLFLEQVIYLQIRENPRVYFPKCLHEITSLLTLPVHRHTLSHCATANLHSHEALKDNSTITYTSMVHNDELVTMTSDAHHWARGTDNFPLHPTNTEQPNQALVSCHGKPAVSKGQTLWFK